MTLLTPVAVRLRLDLLAGAYAPGSRLVEQTLIQRYRTARSPVRAALALLESDGLVIHESNLGARVKLIGFDEAADIAHTLSVLESATIARASSIATAEDTRRLRGLLAVQGDAVRSGGVESAVAALHELRTGVFGLAGSHASAELIGVLDDRRLLFRQRFESSRNVIAASYRYHRSLLDAMSARDVARALAVVDTAAGLMRAEIQRRAGRAALLSLASA